MAASKQERGPAQTVGVLTKGHSPGDAHDPQAGRRQIPPLFPQEGPQDRQAPHLIDGRTADGCAALAWPMLRGTFDNRKVAEKHERDVQYFKRH
jgi:hypothetical protein